MQWTMRSSSPIFRLLVVCLVAAVVITTRAESSWGTVKVLYQMPANGQLTLGLYDTKGALLRWLVQDDFRRAGPQDASWDGLDQWGRKVPAGSYLLRGIYHAPLQADYLMTLCNPGTPPWPTADGRGDWLCDEANPQAAVTDGKWVFLGSAGSEKGYSIIALDEKGQRRWGTDEPKHFHPRCLSLALDGNFLYALYSGPERPDPDTSPYPNRGAVGRAVLVCLDKQTGRPARFTRSEPQLKIATWPYREKPSWLWDLRQNHAFTPAVYGGQPRYACLDVGEPTNALGIAAIAGRLYVSLFLENKLLELDATTGHPTGREFPLTAPVGLCPRDKQTLLAVSGTKIVAVDVASGHSTNLITTGLAAPDDIAVDRDKNIYVSDWGSSSQVKVFDPQGHFLRTIGKEGGRPWVGTWDASGMLVPRGIAITDEHKLWVAEDDGSPPRVSEWDANTGAFLRDYLGPAPYGGGTYFWINPHDPSEIHAEGTRFRVDYARKTSIPQAIDYRRQSIADPFTPNGHDLGPHPEVRILYHDGHEYAVINTTSTMVSILQRQGDVYRAVAALGQVSPNNSGPLGSSGTGRITWDSDVGYRLYEGFFPDCFRGHTGDSYSWTDISGDNLLQPEELTWVPMTTDSFRAGTRTQGRWASGWGNDISSDWSFFFATHFRDRMVIFRLDPSGWTSAGAPIYDMTKARPIHFEPPGNGIDGLHITADGKLIVCYDYEGGHSPDAIAAFTLEGQKLWSVAMPRVKAGKALHANNAVYDFNVPGLGDVVCAWLYHGSFRPHFFTSDGLYVGTLLDDTLLQRFFQNVGLSIQYYVGTVIDDAQTGPGALWSESSKYFYQAPDGSCYLVNGGNQQEHLFRIRGLEGKAVGRFEIPYQVP